MSKGHWDTVYVYFPDGTMNYLFTYKTPNEASQTLEKSSGEVVSHNLLLAGVF